MQIAALVPMKGHSERVPGKNLRPLAGKPLSHHVIDALLAVPAIDLVVVNTDSEAIAESLRPYGDSVRINWRSEDVRGDFVSMNKVIEDDLKRLTHEVFLQTHSTNPLLKSETIAAAIERFSHLTPPSDSLFSVTTLQSRFYDESGRPINHNPQELIRTQDLPPVYEENSCLYLFSRASFAANDGRRIGRNPQLFPMDKLESVDIDTETDFLYAEFLCSRTLPG